MIPSLLVRVRRTDDKFILANRLFSGFSGQKFIVEWVLRVAQAKGLAPEKFQFQIGKGNPWQN